LAVLKSEGVPKNSDAAFQVRNGQRLRITERSIVDFAAFNLHDLTERFDSKRAKIFKCRANSRALPQDRFLRERLPVAPDNLA